MGKNIETEPEQKPLTKQEVLQIRKTRITKISNSIRKLVTLDTKQIKKAAAALLKFREENQTDKILDIKDDFIYLEIVLNKVPIKFSLRPVQIKLPNAIYNQEMNSKFCIISTNPQRAFKDHISNFDIPLIQKVIGYEKLNKKYPTYLDKRKLFYEFDQFFCDEKIYGNLAKGLGKVFYERKKIPYPISCENITQDQLNDLANNTYFIQGNGPVYTVKIGRVAQTTDEITQNIVAAAYGVLPEILKEKGMSLSCLRQLSIKLSNSVSLPFYSRLSLREVEAWKRSREQVNKELMQRSSQSYAQQQVAANLLEDPTLYDYDGFVNEKRKEQKAVVIQKKEEKTQPKQAQYLSTIIEQAERRKNEQLAVQSRMNARQALKYGGEIYISESFKQQHDEAKKFETIDNLKEKLNEKKREENKLGILKSLYETNQFQGGNRNMKSEFVDNYKVIENIIDAKKVDIIDDKKQEIQQSPPKQQQEQVLQVKSRSRSRSEEKITLSKEEKMKQYKERYLQRKQQ